MLLLNGSGSSLGGAAVSRTRALVFTRTFVSSCPSSHPLPSALVAKAAARASQPAPLLHKSQLSPSAPPPAKQPYSAATVAIVKALARLMGYNSLTSTAIRVTSDLYDRCAERAHVERHFWYGDCALPETYQSWFQITNLHVYLLLARFRALDNNANKSYSQELINHFFIDAESRMRDRFGVQTSRLVKGYMRDIHMQHRGSVLAYDEGLVAADSRLAQAVWRNIWGAGWGTVAGVKRKLAGVDKTVEGELDDSRGQPELAKDIGSSQTNASPYARAASASLAAAHPELAFPQHLHRIVTFIRAESQRLASLSDREIMLGRIDPKSPTPANRSEEPANASASIAAFRRI